MQSMDDLKILKKKWEKYKNCFLDASVPTKCLNQQVSIGQPDSYSLTSNFVGQKQCYTGPHQHISSINPLVNSCLSNMVSSGLEIQNASFNEIKIMHLLKQYIMFRHDFDNFWLKSPKSNFFTFYNVAN